MALTVMQVQDALRTRGFIIGRNDLTLMQATKVINFPNLAGEVTNGDRYVNFQIDGMGRYLEIVDGFGNVETDADLRNHDNAASLIQEMINKVFGE